MSKRRTEEQKGVSFDNPTESAPLVIRTAKSVKTSETDDGTLSPVLQPLTAPRSKVVLVDPNNDQEMKSVGRVPPETPAKFEKMIADSRGSLQAHRFANEEQFELFAMLPMSDAAKKAFLDKQARAPGKRGGPLWKDTREAVRV